MLKVQKRLIALFAGVTLLYSSLPVSAEELQPKETQTEETQQEGDCQEEEQMEETQQEEAEAEDSQPEGMQKETEQSDERQMNENVAAENQIEENSATPQAEYANTDITIAGVSFVESGIATGASVEGVSYDASTNTLILNNANIIEDLNGSIYTPDIGKEAIYVYTDDELHIRVLGENNVSYMGTDNVTRGTCSAVSLSGFGKVIFQGGGTLNITQSFVRQTSGIEANCDLEVESVTLNINSEIIGDAFLGFTGILVNRTGFTVEGSAINIDASAVKNAGGFYGITDRSTYEGDPFVISNGTITIKGPEGAKSESGYMTMNIGIDSQCRDMQITNSRIYMDMGTAASTFALAGGNRHYISREVMGGNITIEDSYIECRTNGQLREYSSYFQNMEGIENLHFYVGEYAPVRETMFEDVFKYTDENMHTYSRYEGQYRCFIISSEEVEIEISAGDINGDGSINLSDLMMCLNYVSGAESLTDEQLVAADINSDGNVDLTDLMRLLAYTSGQSGTL